MFQARRRDRAVSSLSEYTSPSPTSEQQDSHHHRRLESRTILLNVTYIMAGRLLAAAAQLRMQLVALDGRTSRDSESKRLEFENLLLRVDEALEALSRQHTLQPQQQK